MLGHLPIHYVIESNSQDNLFCFLVCDIKVRILKRTQINDSHHLKLKNEQFIQHTGSSLFTKMYQIVNLENKNKCLVVLEELLKEMEDITDIKAETDIDTLLELSNENLRDDILKLLVKYWKINSTGYLEYRDTLVDLSPYFNLFLSLKENDEPRFEDSFPRYLQFMSDKDQKFLQNDCKHLLLVAENNRNASALLVNSEATGDSEKSLDGDFLHFKMQLNQNDQFIGKKCPKATWIEPDVFEEYLDSCVTSTVDENNDRIIKIDYTFLVNPDVRALFDHESKVVKESLIFNKSMKPVDMIMNNDKLKHLICHPVISLFTHLMSYKYRRIYNMNLFAFLLIFLIPFLLVFFSFDVYEVPCDPTDKEPPTPQNQNRSMPKGFGGRSNEGNEKVSPGFAQLNISYDERYMYINSEIFKESNETLFKDFKNIYDEIFKSDGNSTTNDGNSTTNDTSSWRILSNAKPYQLLLIFYLMTSTLYLTLREIVQMLWINDTMLIYFKKKSNLLEILLVASSWWFLLMILKYSNYYREPAAFIILLASIEILIVLPTSALSSYMFMLRKVSETFLKFFIIFIVIILAFTFSFYALFRPITNTFGDTTSCHNDLHSNYENISVAFLKTTIMFAGNVFTKC